jgi:transglutaminase-like putative cysteine protease
MNFGQVVLGLGSIALGLSQFRKGTRMLASGSRARQAAPGRVHASGHVDTELAGPLRLQTKKIRTLDDRIRELRRLADRGKRDPAIYAFARQAVNSKCGTDWCVNEKDTLGELRALFQAIRSNVRYTSDIAGIDSYQLPQKTLRMRTGDCDDFSTLAAASALSLGIPVRFKVIRTKNAKDWNHIYTEMGVPRGNPQRWVPFDASVSKPFGWEAPANVVGAVRLFPVK